MRCCLNEIEQQLAALKSEQAEVKPWRAEENADFFYLNSSGYVMLEGDCRTDFDNKRFHIGNYYRTRGLAEQDAKELALRGRVRQLRDALCEGYQFVPGGNNFYVHFDVVEKYYFVSIGGFHCVVGTVYFDTKEHAQQACDILNAELSNG